MASRPPAHQREAELRRLEATATRRALTAIEDRRMAELAFQVDRRGGRLTFAVR